LVGRTNGVARRREGRDSSWAWPGRVRVWLRSGATGDREKMGVVSGIDKGVTGKVRVWLVGGWGDS
jgi:hypothetical protein